MIVSENEYKRMPKRLQAMLNKLPNPGSPEVLALFPDTKSGSILKHHSRKGGKPPIGTFEIRDRTGEGEFLGSNGSAARFFYCAKASKAERNAGCGRLPLGEPPASARSKAAEGRQNALGKPRPNNHPTVKPLALIQYLCRLVTPPGGTILDPFFGSGTLGVAAYKEKFIFIGIEQGIKNCEISKARIEQETQQFKLPMVEV